MSCCRSLPAERSLSEQVLPMPVFIHRSVIPATVEQVIAFHAHPRAFARLTPPPVFMQTHRSDLKSLADGEVEFTLWFGPIPSRWLVRHEPGPIPTSFADRQLRGPLRSWRHEHIFQPVADGSVELTDRITYEHRSLSAWGMFTRLVFSSPMLRLLFVYRHLRTQWGVSKRAST